LGGLVNGAGGCGIAKQPLRQKASMRGTIINVAIDSANERPIIMSASTVWDEHVKDVLH